MTEQKTPFAAWCVLELFGHRRLAGYVTEQEIAGHGFLRLDVPGPDSEMVATQFYSPTSVYGITPTTEQVARAVAKNNQPEPITYWEQRAIEAPAGEVTPDDLPFERADGEEDGQGDEDEDDEEA